ncbi:pentatricopeptide repeat-containing protein DOT4, chloroplastic-like [Typha angustifolia]|uniref:pentatricopeptide repeat-containing protein DOT4, chloroplastic-like n=1 Tax=Typha angustifolia TaxID=59011 RepID=UPI003C2C31ED
MSSHFHLIPKLTSLQTWNHMIQSSTRNGLFSESLHLYSSMLRSGVHGDDFTFPFVAKACAKLGSVWDGRKLHAHAILLGFQGNTFVQTSLLDMYSKCSSFSESWQMFVEMPHRGLVSWNCMISAYSKDAQADKSMGLFNEMRGSGVQPSCSTYISLISGCMGSVSALRHGLSVYSCGIKVGVDSYLQFRNSVLSMFVRYGLIVDACLLFDGMEGKSIVTWTAMACGYLRIGDYMKVFDLFNCMRRGGNRLDSIALVNVILAGVQSGSLWTARGLHAFVIQSGFGHEGDIATSLVNLYAKCGDIISARKVFDSVSEKNVFLWTSLISGYVNSGHSREALELFQNLLNSTVRPNEATISVILSACADIGSVAIGEKVEEYIVANRLESDLRVQTGLIRMYCKCGSLQRARKIFDGIPAKDLTVWSTMISGYACHGEGKEALSFFQEMQKEAIKPDAIVLTNILSACSHSGLVDEGLKWFRRMQTDYGIDPTIEHYMCIVDLLSKAGQINIASKFICQMPIKLQNQVWAPLLNACTAHHNSQLGELISKQLLKQEILEAEQYVLMSNVYTCIGKWEEATAFRSSLNKRRLIKEPGWSRIELCN